MEDVVEILATLVGFDTTSERSNLGLIDWVQERLAAAGAECRRLPDDTGEKAGLVARLGPDRPGGLVLSGHTDCVPADGRTWTTAPFVLDRRGERLTGRGTADMKGFLATVLAVLADVDPASLDHPLMLALSRDEELGTLGAPDLVAALQEWGADPRAVIVGEPTGMRPVVAHKGVRSFRTVVTGTAAHSSQPHRAANAVVAGARIAVLLDGAADARRRGPVDDRFDPPHTTVNVGVLEGGSAVNIVPDRCRLVWEYRPVPADDSFALRDEVLQSVEAEVLPRLRRDVPGGGVATESLAVVPTLSGRDSGPAAELVGSAAGVEPARDTVAFGTDGGHFEAAGWPTVVCGPGSIDQAHRPDEFVTRQQLRRSRAMVADLVAHLRAGTDGPG